MRKQVKNEAGHQVFKFGIFGQNLGVALGDSLLIQGYLEDQTSTRLPDF